MSSPEAPRIVFIHIRKTAGTTFVIILNRQFTPGMRLEVRGMSMAQLAPQLESLPELRRRNTRFVTGHHIYGAHDHLPGPTRYVTMLREPIDRVVSSYYFALQEKRGGAAGGAWIAKTGASFEEYLDELVRVGRNDLQTRLIAGEPRPGEPDDLLERAKLHLERDFDLVGLTERFDEAMLLCRRLYGWNNIIYERANVTRRRPKVDALSPELRSAIAATNARDVALYQWARERFAETLRRAQIPPWELSAYRAVNRGYSLVKGTLRPRLRKLGVLGPRARASGR